VTNRPARGRAPLAALAVLAVVALAVPIAAGWPGPRSSPSASPTGSPVAVLPSATPGVTKAPPPTLPPAPPPFRRAVVPVTHFRAPWTSADRDEVLAVLAGTSERYTALELVEGDADEILYQLATTRPTDLTRLVLAADAIGLAADLAADRTRLAFMRADEVSASVRALAWEGLSLFGVARTADLEAWPLAFRESQVAAKRRPADEPSYDPARAWTLVAGGDMLLDRGVAHAVKVEGKGIDFPFDGGTAEITGHTCCSSFGWEVPTTRRTGGEGAVRSLLESADLSIANFENPAPVEFRFHTQGTVFTADPALIEGLVNAGIDYVSLANNHIRDAGAAGLLQTIDALDGWGIAHSGAGADLAAARAPAMLDAAGVKVAILGYDTIAGSYWATADRAGSAQLTAGIVAEDVAGARAAGADLVIVFPHWGTEYRATPFAAQQALAHACVDAGADLVIGNHAHWAGAVEVYNGRPIWYALGNFVFDQSWSEPTMEGVTLELTFDGPRLVQAVMRPHIILDKAQPNFLDPAGDGAVVLNQVFSASKNTLPW
jgi:poly-gamma-glutamate synthesis protein (capsule biosynthesis protein)